jgi:hypothetical protein
VVHMWAAWRVPQTAGPLAVAKKACWLASATLFAALSVSSEASAQCGRPIAVQGVTVNLQSSPLIPVINSVNTAFLTNTTSFVSSPNATEPGQWTGGTWSRVVGGAIDSSSKSTSTVMPGFDVGQLGGPNSPHTFASGSQTCLQFTRQDYTGFQVGTDLGQLNIGNKGGNWHFGITAGGLYLNTEDKTPQSVFTGGFIAAGDLKTKFEVPFIGVYTAYIMGNFFIDGALRWDFYQGSLSSLKDEFIGVKDSARAVSLTSSAGYRLPLMSNWFLEPSVSVSLSRVKVAPVLIPDGPQASLQFSDLRVNDITSFLGRAGLSVGTNVTVGTLVLQPFATASVIHEFEDPVISRIIVTKSVNHILDGFNLGGPGSFVSGTNGLQIESQTERIGTYGQFGFGLAAVAGNTGWLGYGRVDGRVGDSITGFSYNVGLRYQW